MKVCPTCHFCYEDTDEACADASHASLLPVRPGERLIAEKYRLERLLGRGGMGAVYEARHTGLDRAVAVKLLRHDYLEDSQVLERFRREARTVARIRHPNVADIYDYGVLPTGEAYIAMELVVGETLRQLLDRVGPLPVGQAARIGRQLAEGVEAAHCSGVIHRDLKPSNVLLTSDHAGAPQAKVLDFSIAKLEETLASGKQALTTEGEFLGTPHYMSPEQCEGRPLDARSDVYGLGVLMYEMLAGQPPFEGRGAAAVALKQLQDAPAPIQRARADVPEPLAWLVMQALHKKPDFRPQSAAEFADRLRAFKDLEPRQTPWIESARACGAAAAEFPLPFGEPPGATPGARPPAPPEASAKPAPASNPATLPPFPTAEIFPDTRRLAASRDAGPFAAPRDEPAGPLESSITPHAFDDRLEEAELAAAVPSDRKPTGFTDGKSLPTDVRVGRASPRRASLIYAGVAGALALAAMLVSLVIRSPGTRPSPPRGGPTVAQSHPAPEPPVRVRAEPTRGPLRPTPPVSVMRRTEAPPPAAPEAAPARRPERPGSPSRDADAAPSRRVSGATASSGRGSESGIGEPALRRALGDWIATTNAADVAGHVVFYMPIVRRFYLTRDVPRSFVHAEKARLFQRATRIDVRAGDPQIETAGDGRTATMRFRKRYVIEGPRARRGEVEQELVWVKTAGGWKIIGERDARVIR